MRRAGYFAFLSSMRIWRTSRSSASNQIFEQGRHFATRADYW